MALFTVQNLRYAYGTGKTAEVTDALDISELQISAGSINVLLGPNGSGKTTLLKLLNRLLTPAAGSIRFHDRNIAHTDEIRSKTVYVHQNPLLFAGTVHSNVAYGLKLRKFSHGEIKKRVDRSLEVVGLQGFQRRKSTELSGGEAQRVAIARALVVEPEALLLDEPTSSVDKHNISRIENILTSIRTNYGCSIIISTHNLPFAYRMCDRLIKLDEGRIVPSGENIMKGKAVPGDSAYRIFRTDGIELFCPDIEGDFNTAVVDYDRVLLSTSPLHSSAQNSFKGKVETIQAALQDEDSVHLSHGLVDVTVQVESTRLTSRITGKSLAELSLEEGSEIWLAFKASSLRLY